MGETSLTVWSEVDPLRAVLLHRPGEELNNLTPRYLEDLLFDEIPWLRQAQGGARCLRPNSSGARGTGVLYRGSGG